MIAVAGGGAQFWRGAWREGPWEGSRLSRLESVPSRGMSRGKREEGERGGAAAGRGPLMSVLCEHTLFKVCVWTLANVCSHYPWYYLLTLYRGGGGGGAYQLNFL